MLRYNIPQVELDTTDDLGELNIFGGVVSLSQRIYTANYYEDNLYRGSQIIGLEFDKTSLNDNYEYDLELLKAEIRKHLVVAEVVRNQNLRQE